MSMISPETLLIEKLIITVNQILQTSQNRDNCSMPNLKVYFVNKAWIEMEHKVRIIHS